MPKTGIFDDTMTFSSFVEYREKLMALQYLRGDRDFSDTVRNVLYKAVDSLIDEMDPTKRRRYNQIRENVHAQMVIRKQVRAEKALIKKSTQEPAPE